MVDIVAKVGAGELTEESATAILMTAFPISNADVKAILAGAKQMSVESNASADPSPDTA